MDSYDVDSNMDLDTFPNPLEPRIAIYGYDPVEKKLSTNPTDPMEELLTKMNNLNTINDQLNIFNGRIHSSKAIPKNTMIGKLYGKVRYFWEITPEFCKAFTIDSEMVLDVTDSATCFKDLRESISDEGNVMLVYDIDYDKGEIDNFSIMTIKDINIGDEIIVKFSNF